MSAPSATLSADGGLADVILGKLPLMALGGDLDAIVTDVDGWYDLPDMDGNNIDRVLADGALYGPKVVKAREVTIAGWAVGERHRLMDFRQALVQRLVAPYPVELTIGDPWIGQSLSTSARGSAAMKYEAVGSTAFRYEAHLVCADPRRYETQWSEATIELATGAVSGRSYPRSYQWAYADKVPASTALLTNTGNVPAPVELLYTGPLSESRLVSTTDQIRIAAVPDGVQLLVASDTLVAQAPGGMTRASFVLPGSVPMLVDPARTETWALLGTGAGSLRLVWRGAYA